MPAEASRRARVAWVLGAVLLTMGCAGVPRASLRDTRSPEPQPQASPPSSPEDGAPGPLRRRHSERRRGTDAALLDSGPVAESEPSHAAVTPSAAAEERPAVHDGWPDLEGSDEALLEPFLKCTAPAQFIALQQGVDMARLVEKLEPWSAVRLGALGPLEARASQVLQRKRVSFLLEASRKYSAFAEVFALFVVHSSYDDELGQVLRLLAQDKQLSQTLGTMLAVRQELEQRGLRLTDFPEREEQARDVLRGLARTTDDMLSTIEVVDRARGSELFSRLAQLPPAYREAFDELAKALMQEHYTSGRVVLESFNETTLGVPLGFYHLVASIPQGASLVARGHYEQASRELAPAALMVALYTGGKGMRAVAEARARARLPGELAVLEVRLHALKDVAARLRQQLGEQGFGELARYLQAQREAALLVGAGGEPAAIALYSARGDVAKAQAWLSQARPEPGGVPQPPALGGKSPGRSAQGQEAAGASLKPRAGNMGSLASLVDDAVGLTREVVEAKLHRLEWEATGPRLPADVAALEKLSSPLKSPPPGVPGGSALWGEYVAYRQRRLAELKAGQAAKGPLRWEAYEQLRGGFARGLAFERTMVPLLHADAALPRHLRRFLQDFERPRIETYVGVKKEGTGLRFVDVLILEEGGLPGQLPRVETFSFKSRNLSSLGEKALIAQIVADASEALRYYGEVLNIRRRTLKLRDTEVQVQRVRLIYEGGSLKPGDAKVLEEAAKQAADKVKAVEVLFQ